MPVDYVFIILIIGAVQGFFLSAILFHKRGNRKGNRILALLMALYAFMLLDGAFRQLPFNIFTPFIITIVIGVEFVLGQLHYIYALYIVDPWRRFRPVEWLHFVPLLLAKIYFYQGFFRSGLSLHDFTQNPDIYYNITMLNFLIGAKIILGIIYMITTLLLLRKYSRSIQNSFSSIQQINLNWLRNLTILSLGLWIIALAANVWPLLMGYDFNSSSTSIIMVATTVLVYVLGYMGYVKPEIFSYVETLGQEPPVVNLQDTGVSKYAKTRLDNERADEYFQKLNIYMDKEKPYKSTDLTLKELANRLEMADYQLSQIINDRLNRNFYAFVNEYRVDEVKQKLADPRWAHLSIMGIAEDAGFSSKSTFNSIFKKTTGMTPSDYMVRNKG